MNRIYQGRVSRILDTKKRELSLELLWHHHQLYQDAVNYYIVALAALGISPDSKLSRLREMLRPVWDRFEKNGQERSGMGESMQRSWQLSTPLSLDAAVERFRQDLIADAVPLSTAEKAGEFLLSTLGGDAAIQQNGVTFLPMFCDVEFRGTFRLSREKLVQNDDKRRLEQVLHQELSPESIKELAASISLGSVVNLQPDALPDSQEDVIKRIKIAAKSFEPELPESMIHEWLKGLDPGFSLPKNRGGNINKRRVDACTLFLAFPNPTTKSILQNTFPQPKPDGISEAKKGNSSEFLVNGRDPIQVSRGTRGWVFRGFTSLPLWEGDGRHMAWKKFDVAAFKEALKVYNQFQQNLEKRKESINRLAITLLEMDGKQAMDAYSEPSDHEVRECLERVWRETKGKPTRKRNDDTEEAVTIRFLGDVRIDRLRKIINDDLAEEYRLTEGRKTPYGLRRRTTKGWENVKRRWQGLVKMGEQFSTEKQQVLKLVLDELRGGEKREQIGSHKLFESLLADDAAWSIWRQPDEALQKQIEENQWAADPLDAFREYCEIRESIEEFHARPLNFVPADSNLSRRLFFFTDVCSFGKERGKYKHDTKELAVTVPLAVRGVSGRFIQQDLCLRYSAPRLLRDHIRAEGGSYIQDWAQPMMQALFGDVAGSANPQHLNDAAVQLMPNRDLNGNLRVLLNFPLALNPEALWAKVYEKRKQSALFAVRYSKTDKKKTTPIHSGIWESNVRSFEEKRDFLLWPVDRHEQPPWSIGNWWDKLHSFRVLGADLGTRCAAAVAIIECGTESKANSRQIGEVDGKNWFAQYRSGTILRLPGENATVLRPESQLDNDGFGKAFREELYGERGRPADDAECEQTFAILSALDQSDLLKDLTDISGLKRRFSFPELNDKLLVGIRRAQGWIATCISWHWKLNQSKAKPEHQSALAEIREQKRRPELCVLANGSESGLEKLRAEMRSLIILQMQVIQEQLLQVTHRILPLRGRQWEWISHPNRTDCHLLRQVEVDENRTKVRLRGQRGLSMARIEQLAELRRRWQSLNQSLRREIGQRPLTASEMRGQSIPDPCPDILIKLENIREQRVNQTAHLIIARALGLRLRIPQGSKGSRSASDSHGEYDVVTPPVDFIVLEDLTRYLSEQGRARSENTRLMKWCHRAITQKVKMLAEPFGIPVLETPAAYSSRFCSLTGVPGFRGCEVSWEDRNDFRWHEAMKADLEGIRAEIAASANNRDKLAILSRRLAAAKATQELFRDLEEISRSSRPNLTLVAPQPGGPLFITTVEVPHPVPSEERKRKKHTGVLPKQADLNAAINLALRAVAAPSCAGIHHRLRTQRKPAGKGSVAQFSTREKRRFGERGVSIIPQSGNDLPKEKNSNFFFDAYRIVDFGRARLETDDSSTYDYASGPGLWKKVNDLTLQWDRCRSINSRRLAKWKNEPEDDIPM